MIPGAANGTRHKPARELPGPLLFFIGAKAFVALLALGADADPFAAESYARWDSGHYLAIATRGYSFAECAEPGPARWCGNVAWLPGYSLLIRLLERAGLPGPWGGMLLGSLAHLLTLFILWRRSGQSANAGGLTMRGRLLLMGIAAFFPGMIYYHAIFPVALFVLAVLLYLLALERMDVARAALWGFAAALVYSPGILLTAVGACWSLALMRGEPRLSGLAGRALLAGGGPVLGFGSALLIQYLDTGEWFGFFYLQTQYGRDFAPAGVIVWLFEELFTSPFRPVRIAAFQSICVAVFVAALIAIVAWRNRPAVRQTLSPGTWAALFYLIIVWLVPLAFGRGLSLYRSEACLMPAFVYLLAGRSGHTKDYVAGALLCLALVFAGLMGDLFFRDMLV